MILALCADDKLGLQFNHRRQSRDRAVISDLLENAGTLWIHPFSEKLFLHGSGIEMDENFLALAGEDDWCFVEDTAYLEYTDRIKRIILYRWNRVYPRDMVFEFPGEWKLVQSSEFCGSSHEKITREVYIQ